MKQFYTYLHCKLNGDPFYVGKGCAGRSNRMEGRGEHHKRIVAKHGVEIFVFPRISEQDAFDTEIRWIRLLKEAGYLLCNRTIGGEGASGNIQSAETIAKRFSKNYGQKRTDETRKKISNANKGKTSANKGIPMSTEQKIKISLAHTGKTHSPETKLKMSLAASRRLRLPCSDETKLKIGIANSGRVQPVELREKKALLYKALPEETRERMSRKGKTNSIRNKKI